MKLPRSSYYYHSKSQELSLEDQALGNRIEEITEEFPKYGYRKVTRELHRKNIPVNHKKVHRIMREKGLLVTNLNQAWVADITYIRIAVGFVYLAVILDLCSRKAIGYAISRTIDTSLSLSALRMAIQSRNPPAGVIHHSDRGIQYAAHDYIDELKNHRFQISMSRRGNPYDNAFAESFMKTIKTEEVYLWEYRTLDDVLGRLPYFIEQVYNQKRLHASLDYVPPVEYEAMLINQNQKAPCPIALS
jgi:putative transposase